MFRTIGRGIQFNHFKPLAGLEIPFAAKPVVHGGLEAGEGDAMAGLEQAVGDRKGVVKDGVVGEVAHGEVVDPADGTGMTGAGRVNSLN